MNEKNLANPPPFANVRISAQGVPEVGATDAVTGLNQVEVIDVRRPDEYVGELGHIKKARLATLESDFAKILKDLPREKNYLFVCRSGGRSNQAAAYAQSQGFMNVYNLIGGMISWNQLGFEIER